MLALKLSLFNREYILMNVLKALASIISMCNLHAILLSKITSRYFTSCVRIQLQAYISVIAFLCVSDVLCMYLPYDRADHPSKEPYQLFIIL
jgi:hypothetical protein